MSRRRFLGNRAQKRIAAVSLLLILLAIIALFIMSAMFFYRLITNDCMDGAKRSQMVLAETLEYYDLESLKNSDTLEDVYSRRKYELLCNDMEYISRISGARYCYLFTVTDNNEMRYLTCVASDKEESKVMQKERGLGVKVKIPQYDRKNIGMAKNGSFSGPTLLNNKYGTVLIFYFPIYRDGEISCVAGIDYDISSVRNEVRIYTEKMILIFSALLIAVLGLLLLILNKKILTPIKMISTAMNSFDPEKERQTVKVHSYYEIEEINQSFNKLTEDITGYISHLKIMTAERAHTAAELSIARRIQNGLVPHHKTLRGCGYELYAEASPAKEVGGDFYDLFELDGRAYFVIADVSGKGIAAAFFMGIVMNLIRGKLRSGMSPAEALNSANDELCSENPEGMFVTVFAAVLEPCTGELIFANAGHTRPLLISRDGKRFIEPDPGIAMGLFENAGIINESVLLSRGDSVTVYTDGVTEAVSKDKQLFGEERLIELAADGSAEQTAGSVVGAVRSFSEGCEQSDDITIITVHLSPKGKGISLEYPCDIAYLKDMQQQLREFCADSKNTRRIILACEEVLVNIIDYSGSENVGIQLLSRNDVLAVRFEDSGEEFDPVKETPPKKSFDEYDEGGMGIRMAEEIAEKIRYSRVGDKNILTLLFAL